MAENKKSVLLYCDIIHTVEKLTDEQAGALFRHYLRYINDLQPKGDNLTEIVFEPIKQNLKRDLMKWDEFRKRQSENGKRGGRPKNQGVNIETQKTQAFSGKPKKAVKVTVKVKDTVKVKEINIKGGLSDFLPTTEFQEFWKMYPKKVCLPDAQEMWNGIVKNDPEIIDEIKKAIAWQKISGCLKDVQYSPKAHDWLKGKRWQDEFAEAEAKAERTVDFL